MVDWLKKNKKFIVSIVILILQNVGVVPTGSQAVSDVTNPVGE